MAKKATASCTRCLCIGVLLLLAVTLLSLAVHHAHVVRLASHPTPKTADERAAAFHALLAARRRGSSHTRGVARRGDHNNAPPPPCARLPSRDAASGDPATPCDAAAAATIPLHGGAAPVPPRNATNVPVSTDEDRFVAGGTLSTQRLASDAAATLRSDALAPLHAPPPINAAIAVPAAVEQFRDQSTGTRSHTRDPTLQQIVMSPFARDAAAHGDGLTRPKVPEAAEESTTGHVPGVTVPAGFGKVEFVAIASTHAPWGEPRSDWKDHIPAADVEAHYRPYSYEAYADSKVSWWAVYDRAPHVGGLTNTVLWPGYAWAERKKGYYSPPVKRVMPDVAGWQARAAGVMWHRVTQPDRQLDRVAAAQALLAGGRRDAAEERCQLTVGAWCWEAHAQEPVEWRAPPLGVKRCEADCRGRGRCDHDVGRCLCSAGWTGDSCERRQARPCQMATTRFEKRINFGERFQSFCTGVCDDNIGHCFCNGTFGHKYSQFGIPYATVDGRPGRPMGHNCQPQTDHWGLINPKWGSTPNEKLFGPDGYCNAADSEFSCSCPQEGMLPKQRCRALNNGVHTCLNACTGHGSCLLGFCLCHAGWFGEDCSRLAGVVPATPRVMQRWEAVAALAPAAEFAWPLWAGTADSFANASERSETPAVTAKAGPGGVQAAGSSGGEDRAPPPAVPVLTWSNGSFDAASWPSFVRRPRKPSKPTADGPSSLRVTAQTPSHLLPGLVSTEAAAAVGARHASTSRAVPPPPASPAPGHRSRHLFTRDEDDRRTAQPDSRPAERARPLVYVYDMDPIYTQRQLQYRTQPQQCLHRTTNPETNKTQFGYWTYGTEQAFHEMLLQSRHRTFDPAEADLFYIPVYTGCYAWPVHGWTRFPYFSPDGPTDAPLSTSRASSIAYMALAAKRWVQARFPFWNRTGGVDHVMLLSHDEGSCLVPGELRPMTLLSHWGRMDAHHRSGTAYELDDYSTPPPAAVRARLKAEGRLDELHTHLQGWSCFDPAKDVVIPTFKPWHHLSDSVFAGAATVRRDILLFMRGDVGGGGRLPCYSRSIRQAFARLSSRGLPGKDDAGQANADGRVFDEPWSRRYRIWVGDHDNMRGKYSDLLQRSVFCLVAPGDGWSPRAEDAIPHGCVPLVVMDNVSAPLQPHLDWPSFSVRLAEADIPNTPQILLSIPPARVRQLQANLAKVWHRFVYTSGPSTMAARVKHRRSTLREANMPQERAAAGDRTLPARDAANAPAGSRSADALSGCNIHSNATAGAAPPSCVRADPPTAASNSTRSLLADGDGAQKPVFTREPMSGADPKVLDLFRKLAALPLLPEPGDGARDADDDAFSTCMQILMGRVESLKRGALALSLRMAL